MLRTTTDVGHRRSILAIGNITREVSNIPARRSFWPRFAVTVAQVICSGNRVTTIPTCDTCAQFYPDTKVPKFSVVRMKDDTNLRSDNNGYSIACALSNHHFLCNKNFLRRYFNTKVTSGHHNAISDFNNVVKIPYTFVVLDFRNNLDVLSPRPHYCSDHTYVAGFTDEGGKYHVNLGESGRNELMAAQAVMQYHEVIGRKGVVCPV